MRKILLALASSTALSVSPVLADNLLLLGVGSGKGGGGGGGYTGYTGIGDLGIAGTVVGYWGGDCYTKNGTTNVAQVYDTNTSQAVATVQCVNGTMTATQLNSSGWTWASVQSNCTSTRCLLYRLYDQTGSMGCNGLTCDMQAAPSATANAPYLVYANGTTTCDGVNAGHLCFPVSSSTPTQLQALNPISSSGISQPINLACVAAPNASTSNGQWLWQTSSSGVGISFGSGPVWVAYAGTAQSPGSGGGTFASGSIAVMFAGLNGASSIAQQNNGTANSGNAGTSGFNQNSYFRLGFGLDGVVMSCFLTDTTAWTTTNTGSMYSTWNTIWGGELS